LYIEYFYLDENRARENETAIWWHALQE